MNMSSFKNWLKSHVIFPDEADMELGQRQIYQKFSVVMTAMLFIYMIVMKQGKAYEMMVGLVSLGYLMSTLLMIRDLLFRKQSDKWLKMLWYTSLAMIPIISSYAILINNGSNMILANAVISLMALGLFYECSKFCNIAYDRLYIWVGDICNIFPHYRKFSQLIIAFILLLRGCNNRNIFLKIEGACRSRGSWQNACG